MEVQRGDNQRKDLTLLDPQRTPDATAMGQFLSTLGELSCLQQRPDPDPRFSGSGDGGDRDADELRNVCSFMIMMYCMYCMCTRPFLQHFLSYGSYGDDNPA